MDCAFKCLLDGSMSALHILMHVYTLWLLVIGRGNLFVTHWASHSYSTALKGWQTPRLCWIDSLNDPELFRMQVRPKNSCNLLRGFKSSPDSQIWLLRLCLLHLKLGASNSNDSSFEKITYLTSWEFSQVPDWQKSADSTCDKGNFTKTSSCCKA